MDSCRVSAKNILLSDVVKILESAVPLVLLYSMRNSKKRVTCFCKIEHITLVWVTCNLVLCIVHWNKTIRTMSEG